MAITHRSYNSPAFDSLRAMLGQVNAANAQTSGQSGIQSMKGQQALQQQDRDAQLKAILMGKQHADDKKAAEEAIERNTDVIGPQPEGSGMHVDAKGGMGYTPDPAASLQKMGLKGESDARGKAINQYNSESKSIGDKLTFAKQMADAIDSSDPNARGSIVQAYMGLHGFKRFQDKESFALAEPTVKEQASRLLSKVGISPDQMFDGGSLTEGQKHQFSKDTIDSLGGLSGEVSGAKQRALNSYQTQAYSSPEGASKINGLGGEFDSPIKDISTRLGKHIIQQPSAAPGISAPAASTSPVPIMTPEQWNAAKKSKGLQSVLGTPNGQ